MLITAETIPVFVSQQKQDFDNLNVTKKLICSSLASELHTSFIVEEFKPEIFEYLLITTKCLEMKL